MTDQDTCETCRWWDSSCQKAHFQPNTTGACRVNPPRLDRMTGVGIWPFTGDTDWCAAYFPFPPAGEQADG